MNQPLKFLLIGVSTLLINTSLLAQSTPPQGLKLDVPDSVLETYTEYWHVFKYQGSKQFPAALFKMKNLKTLRVTGIHGETVFDQRFNNLRHLKNLHLDLSSTVTRLPEQIFQFTDLENLYLAFANIEVLPDKFDVFENLKSLKFERFRKLKAIPNSVRELSDTLEELMFYECGEIARYPEYLNNFSKLTSLVIYTAYHSKYKVNPEINFRLDSFPVIEELAIQGLESRTPLPGVEDMPLTIKKLSLSKMLWPKELMDKIRTRHKEARVIL